eukprot:CAMPEP_0197421710 /NCGR_PEP_ID=MMETSP1170-20131217/10739_1 /TAXON_ID=54406 /ORGANISM="Sarcinochrysis sp, Strain CCMP770" /LENGTH=108 /DNA_ID=CAMNT_0042948981 /DNA_START=73 /DNA_END=399 /DNA_ORIENTATION=+
MAEKTDLVSETPAFSSGANFASSPVGSSDGAPSNAEALQRIVLQEQQKALVQQVIAKLTEVSFDQCIDKPQASLTSYQRACVHTVVGKYLDTSEFVIGRATKGRQGPQ